MGLPDEFVSEQPMRERAQAIMDDLGGSEHISQLKQGLARRLVHLELMLEGAEHRVVSGQLVDIGGWTQMVNTYMGLARLLGIERQARRMTGVQEYLSKRRSTRTPREPPP